MEDVVISLTGRAGPDMTSGVADRGRQKKKREINNSSSNNRKKRSLFFKKEKEKKLYLYLAIKDQVHLEKQSSPQLLDILQVANEDFMIDRCS